MEKLLKLLLTYKLKAKQQSQKTRGFTLIELLVGLVLAFLIIIPLLGFMVNMVQTDRQEQAKATSEQEIQAALNYIARDLDQAVFIYDGFGLTQISPSLPAASSGTRQGVPVLAFWKRKYLSEAIQYSGFKDDAFAYALVVYYLLKDTNCAPSTWSCTAQIGRVELQAEVKKGNSTLVAANPTGFPLFNLSSNATLATASFEQKMNAWPNGGSYNRAQNINILIDYIDQSPADATTLANDCPTNGRPTPRPDVPAPQAGVDYTTQAYIYRRVPTAQALTQDIGTPISGFYACVETEKNTAKVYIRGNALARLRTKTSPPTYVASQATYFPRASILVKARGFFGDTQQ